MCAWDFFSGIITALLLMSTALFFLSSNVKVHNVTIHTSPAAQLTDGIVPGIILSSLDALLYVLVLGIIGIFFSVFVSMI